MKCKFSKSLSDVGFCKTAGYYCTFEQEYTCKFKREEPTMNEMKPQEIYSIIKTMEELSKNAHNFESAGNKVVPADDVDKALEIVRRVACRPYN